MTKSELVAGHRPPIFSFVTTRLATAFVGLLAAALLVPAGAQSQAKRAFTPEDVLRVKDVGSLALSPDGEWVAYTVRTTDIAEDRRSADLYMVSWDGATRLQLTHTEKQSEGHPRFSPDGTYLGFIAARGDGGDDKDPKNKSQIWLLNRAGGEAQRLTEVPGGVSSFEWSPDGQQLVLVSQDPDPEDLPEQPTESGASNADTKAGKKKSKTKPPIVVNRYQFKRDRQGYLTHRYQRLYLFDLANKN